MHLVQVNLKFKKKIFYYTVPLLIILVFSLLSGFFCIDERVINGNYLWDIGGRPYKAFLADMNLPHSEGAMFIFGEPCAIEKIDIKYGKYANAHIFSCQILSFAFGIRITSEIIALIINSLFCVFSILFSLSVGYLVFKNGYISIPILFLIIILRNSCPGLIYGIPDKYSYPVFNPFIAFCIFIFIVEYIKGRSKNYWINIIFLMSGFVIAYIAHARSSEKLIIISSLIVFTPLMFIEFLRIYKNPKKIIFRMVLLSLFMYAGYCGYQKMIEAFIDQRDNKCNISSNQKELFEHKAPISLSYHILFISLFRYPNETNYNYSDLTGFKAIYEKYPELERKYSTNYYELAGSREYNIAIKKEFYNFIISNPKHVITYLYKSIYDYILFLPYATWSGEKSSHAYLPQINDDAVIETQDLSPDFNTLPVKWVINLKLKYLPDSTLFWLYFICAYLLFAEAVYTSFAHFKKKHTESIVSDGLTKHTFLIYLLWGMLIYFFFASVVRIIIPVRGHSAVVAFNVLISYNLLRIISEKSIKVGRIEISLWKLLSCVLMLSLVWTGIVHWGKRIANNVNCINSNINIVDALERDNSLRIKTLKNMPGEVNFLIPIDYPAIKGKKYKISMLFNTGNAKGSQIKVGCMMDSAHLFNSVYAPLIDTPSALWKRYEGVFTVQVRDVNVRMDNLLITLVNESSDEGKIVYFDDILLQDIETGAIIFHEDFNGIIDKLFYYLANFEGKFK
jgi:hypothetical protein